MLPHRKSSRSRLIDRLFQKTASDFNRANKRGSTSSLIAGLTFGSILAYGAYQTSIDEKNYILSLVTTSTLGAVMLIRFYNSGKFMPAGLICSLSGIMLMKFVYKNMLSTR